MPEESNTGNELKNIESFLALEGNWNTLIRINANEMEQSVYTRNSFPQLSGEMCTDISAEFRREIKANDLLAVICGIAHALNGWRKIDGGLLFTKAVLYYVGEKKGNDFSIPYEEIEHVDFETVVNDPEGVLLKNGELNYERIAEDVRLYNLFMQEADPEKMVDESASVGDGFSGLLTMAVTGVDYRKISTCKDRHTNLIMVYWGKSKQFQHELETRVKQQNGWGKKVERLILTNKENKKFYIPGKRFNVRVMYNFFMDYIEYRG